MARPARPCRRRRPVVALRPARSGPSKRWPATSSRSWRARLTAQGCAVWVLGGPGETDARRRDRRGGRPACARPHLATTCATRSSRSRARARRCPTIPACCMWRPPSARRRIGIFGPTSPWHWAPLNPLAAVDRDPHRRALPALPQAGLPADASPLHARHPGRPGADRRRTHVLVRLRWTTAPAATTRCA